MKDNVIIAEFMGLPKEKVGLKQEVIYGLNQDDWYTSDNLNYHISWDWLMPVVEKIDEISDENILFKIEHNRAFIEDIENYHIFIDVISNSRIEATYKAVVEFIKDRG